MAINYSCPHCEFSARFPDSYSGKSAECAACGETFKVEKSKLPRSKSPGAGLIILICLVLVVSIPLVCAIGVVLFTLTSRFTYVALKGVEGNAQRVHSENNLKSIGVALQKYYDDHDGFPPPYIADQQGMPLLSWRVLILPYLGEEDLFHEFNLNEPWNSTTNLPLTQRMPGVFRSLDHSGSANTTDYAAIVGDETVFSPTHRTQMKDISDGLSKTIIVGEIKQPAGKFDDLSNLRHYVPPEPINWAEPRDIEFDKSAFVINLRGNDLGNNRGSGCSVLMADGTVRFLKLDTHSKIVRSLLTKAGKEEISEGDY